jgi:hypothetical protein
MIKITFISNKQKCLFSFFFYKNGEQEGRTGPEEGVGTSRSREVAGKGGRRVNTVQKMCTHVCKCKNDN